MLQEFIADVRDQTSAARLALRRLKDGKLKEVQVLVIVGRSMEGIDKALERTEQRICKLKEEGKE